MKKAIVPICIVLFILVVVIVNSFGNEPRRPRSQSSGNPQPSRFVGDYSPSEETTSNDGNDGSEMITIIGAPDTSESNPSTDVETSAPLLVKSSKVRAEHILHRIAYTTSYNKETRNANWVSWTLTREHTDGPFSRKGVPYCDEKGKALGISSFSPEIVRYSYFMDMQAPRPRQEHSDWRDHPADIDHGHMCPAADCRWSKEVMNQSFLLTNMCPQNHTLNEDDWNTLEDRCRTWANKYGEIFIVAGPIYYDGVKNTFGANKIAIPDAFFKVILCMKNNPKAIGFIYKNDASRQPMRNQVKSVDEVEEITGFDFFYNLPDEIEDNIEAKASLSDW